MTTPKEQYELDKASKHRCGNCEHGRLVPQDMSIRICRGAPPSNVIMPKSPGRLQMEAHYPIVSALDEGCGMFKQKLLIDMPVEDAVKQP